MKIAIQLNGEPFEANAGVSVAALLQQLKLRRQRIAVEINKSVVPKANFDHTIIKDGDQVEIIDFVGGG